MRKKARHSGKRGGKRSGKEDGGTFFPIFIKRKYWKILDWKILDIEGGIMHFCKNAQMQKCTNAQMQKCTNAKTGIIKSLCFFLSLPLFLRIFDEFLPKHLDTVL